MADRRLLAGAGLALLSSLAFAALTVSAVLAYREGADPMAAVIIRFPGAIVVLMALLLISGKTMRLGRRDTLVCWGLGILVGAQSFTLYKSFELIPVALTMVIFYVYPLIVSVVAGITGKDRITLPLAVALIVAFVGLCTVFLISGSGPPALVPLGAIFSLRFWLSLVDVARAMSWGELYAALSALSWAALTLLSVRVMRECDPRAASLNMQFSATAIFLVIWLIAGEVAVPSNPFGWGALLAMPVFYAVAITAYFGAVAVAGSVRASFLMNVEPIFTITLGFVVLGQTLTSGQLAGAALVIGAIFAVKWDADRRVAAGS